MNFAPDAIQSLIAHLRRDGWVCDEQLFGSYAFEHRKDEIYADVREANYEELLDSGGCAEDGGGRAIYYFYEPERLSYEEALIRAKRWLRENE